MTNIEKIVISVVSVILFLGLIVGYISDQKQQFTDVEKFYIATTTEPFAILLQEYICKKMNGDYHTEGYIFDGWTSVVPSCLVTKTSVVTDKMGNYSTTTIVRENYSWNGDNFDL